MSIEYITGRLCIRITKDFDHNPSRIQRIPITSWDEFFAIHTPMVWALMCERSKFWRCQRSDLRKDRYRDLNGFWSDNGEEFRGTRLKIFDVNFAIYVDVYELSEGNDQKVGDANAQISGMIGVSGFQWVLITAGEEFTRCRLRHYNEVYTMLSKIKWNCMSLNQLPIKHAQLRTFRSQEWSVYRDFNDLWSQTLRNSPDVDYETIMKFTPCFLK
jgi:hypothetical protein